MIRFFELRMEKGLSQRDMAKICNISQATYNNWENGKTQPSIEQLIALAKFYAVSVDYLIGNSDDDGVVRYDDPKLSSGEKQLLHNYKSLSSESREIISKLMQNMRIGG